MYELAAFRALQGLGAGGLFSLALAIIGDMVPPRERARYQGYFLAVFGTSGVLGPVVGGALAGQDSLLGVAGWRWIFLVNVPIGIAALALVGRVLHLPHLRRDHRIDYAGAAALVIALVPLLIVAEQGRLWGWTAPPSLACLGVGAVGLALFALAERRMGDEALLPMRLLRIRTFSVGSVLNLIIGIGMFGGLAALPLYLQIVKGKTPTEAGLLLLPLTVGIMTGSVFAGRAIARTGRYRAFPIAGTGVLVVGMLAMSRLGVETSLVTVGTLSVLFGLGLGLNMQPLVVAVQNAVPARDMGVATASATFFRQMGGTIGTAALLSVLFGTVVAKIRDAIADPAIAAGARAALADPAVLADPANRVAVDAVRTGGSGVSSGALDDSSFIGLLDPRLARPFQEGFADAIGTAFLLGAAALVLAFVVVLFLPEIPLRTQSGLEAQHAEAAGRRAAEQATAGHRGSQVPAPLGRTGAADRNAVDPVCGSDAAADARAGPPPSPAR
jgi:predicted MFS family arabinose efflux permease